MLLRKKAPEADERRYLPVCHFAEGDAEGDGAPSGGQGGEAGQGGGEGGKGEGGEKGGGKKPSGDAGGDQGKQFVTPEILSGVLDAHKRTQNDALKKQSDVIKALQTSIEQLNEKLAKSGDAGGGKPSGGGKGGKQDETETIELRRRVDQLAGKLKEATSRAEEEARLRQEESFQREVIDALSRAKCLKPSAVFRVIASDLKRSEDGRVFATVKTEYGEEDLDIDKYIERVVREEQLPELFEGTSRSGAPAGGDKGGKGGPFQFTRDQILDPETYLKDIEKSRKAVEQGGVKGIPARGG